MKTSNRLPWFPFFPSDWLSNMTITLMTPAEEGGYIRLLSHAWNNPDCTIPDDDDQLALLSRLGELWFKGASIKLRACFMPHPKKPGRLIDGKLYKEFLKVTRYCKERSASGTKGAQSRWKHKQLHDGLDDGSAIAQPLAEPMANDGNTHPHSDSDSDSHSNTHTPPDPERVCVPSSMSQELKAKQIQTHKKPSAWSAEDAQAASDAVMWYYPKKIATGDVEAWFRTHPVTLNMQRDIVLAIQRQAKTGTWMKDEGRWIPELAKWLKGERWKDKGVTVKPRLAF